MPDRERSRPRPGIPAAVIACSVGMSRPRCIPAGAVSAVPGRHSPRSSRIPVAPCCPGRAVLSRPRLAVPAAPCCPGRAVLSRPRRAVSAGRHSLQAAPSASSRPASAPPRPGRRLCAQLLPAWKRRMSWTCPSRRRRLSRPARSAGYAPLLFPQCTAVPASARVRARPTLVSAGRCASVGCQRDRRKEPKCRHRDRKWALLLECKGKAYVHGVEGKRERCVLPCAQELKSPGEGKNWYLSRVEKKRRDKRSCLVIGIRGRESCRHKKICDMPAVGPSQINKEEKMSCIAGGSVIRRKSAAGIKEVTADIERSSDVKKEPGNILPSCRVRLA
jgi:hypothetical protein